MLQLDISNQEYWDEVNEEFITVKGQSLKLEHSLVSISKWEAIWNKAFLTNKQKTPEQVLSYIRCMTVTPNVPPEVYSNLTQDNVNTVCAYIEKSQSATSLPESSSEKGSKDVVTSELIYYWMTALNIPFECEKWHLSRLLSLIGIANLKNQPSKKGNKAATAAHYRALNAARRKKFNTKG